MNSLKKDSAKLIQWVVFAALLAVLGWCFWVYYDTNTQITKTGESNTPPPATVNEAKLNSVLEKEEIRRQNFNTPPLVSYDPFQ